ncbi:MAG: class B sortase [Clostridiales bacterium]|jgi:sortase B|nr:class B sortase [Clostridiales bacterium]
MHSKGPNIINLILHILLIAILLGGAGYYIRQAYADWSAERAAEIARLEYERVLAEEKLSPLEETPKPLLQLEDEAAAPAETPTPTASPSASPTPTAAPREIQPLFQELRQQYNNDDIVGYLKIDGTSIDYLVTQSSDNRFYLTKDIYKNDNVAGWVFMDYENDVSKDDLNTIIYGHNMKNDIMFHSLRNYQSQSFYNNHKYITFNTIYENATWEIFSFYRTDIYFRYIQVLFPSVEDFFSLATEMKARSAYDTGVELRPGDRVLTLSTCTNESEETRFVVNARLMKEDE